MLHIHNGDCSAEVAKQSSLPGEHFAFREALIEGPTPSNLTLLEWQNVRSEHLAKAYGVDKEFCERESLEEARVLNSSREHDEVVLWFEYDLFCQLNLIYLLNWFSRQELGNTTLNLICIDKFPGKESFRGLGELNPDELASLFPSRQKVTDEQLSLAATAWAAYTSNDPSEVQTLVTSDTLALPLLGDALKAHLRRFPSTRNGLGYVENRSLELIQSGLTRFADLFPRFGQAEPIYGLGDIQFWLALERLSNTSQPLLKTAAAPNGNSTSTGDPIHKSSFEITELGKEVLNGKADFVKLNGLDCWLGGVYLSGDTSIWRWDEDSECLVFTN